MSKTSKKTKTENRNLNFLKEQTKKRYKNFKEFIENETELDEDISFKIKGIK